MIDKYGVHFDPALRDQVVARYQNLDLPTYWTGINPELTATFDSNKKVSKVEISYPRDYRQAATRLQRDVRKMTSRRKWR